MTTFRLPRYETKESVRRLDLEIARIRSRARRKRLAEERRERAGMHPKAKPAKS